MDEARRAELGRWARSVAEGSESADARAAARAIALLLEEVSRLERELESLQGDERAPRAGRSARGGTVALVAVGLVSAAAALGVRALAPDLAAAGPSPGARIGAVAAERLVFSVEAEPDTLARVRWRVDGADVTARVHVSGRRSVLRGSDLPDGEHRIEAVVPRRLPHFAAGRSWHVSIDRTPPQVHVDRESAQAPRGEPVRLRGTVEPGSRVRVRGKDAP